MAENITLKERVAKLEGMIDEHIRFFHQFFSLSRGVDYERNKFGKEDTMAENITLEERVAKLEERLDEHSKFLSQSCLKSSWR